MMINHPKKSIFLRSEPAPIILFVYNRIEELKETINALQNNYFAGDSDLYVFSDGPKLCKPNDKERVEKVRDLLHGFLVLSQLLSKSSLKILDWQTQLFPALRKYPVSMTGSLFLKMIY